MPPRIDLDIRQPRTLTIDIPGISREPLVRTESEIRRERIWNNLGELYPDKTFGEREAIQREIYKTIATRGAEYRAEKFPPQPVGFTQRDINIITYPDSVYKKGSNQYGHDSSNELRIFVARKTGLEVTIPT